MYMYMYTMYKCTCICSLCAKLFLWNSFIVILKWNAHNFIKIRGLKENTHLKQYELQCMCWKFSLWFPIYLKWQKKIINMFYIPVLITVSHIFLGKAIYSIDWLMQKYIVIVTPYKHWFAICFLVQKSFFWYFLFHLQVDMLHSSWFW